MGLKWKDMEDKIYLWQKTLGLMEERIKLAEGTLKKLTDALDKRAEEKASHLSPEARLEASEELRADLTKRLEALEEVHASVLKGSSDYEGYPARKGISHSHEEVKK